MNYQATGLTTLFVEIVDNSFNCFGYGTHRNDNVGCVFCAVINEWRIVPTGDFR